MASPSEALSLLSEARAYRRLLGRDFAREALAGETPIDNPAPAVPSSYMRYDSEGRRHMETQNG